MINPPTAPKYKESSKTKKWVIGCFLVCPLLCCGGTALYARKWVDIFDNSADLDRLVVEAKKQGFPMESKDLVASNIVLDSENSYPEVAKLMQQVPKLSAITKTIADFKPTRGGTVPDSTERFIERSRAIAKFSKFDAHKDYDLGFYVLYPEYTYLKQAARALAMQAEQDAANGKATAAIEGLAQIRRIGDQLIGEKVIIGGLVNIAIDSIYLRTAGHIIQWLEKDTDAMSRVKKSLESKIVQTDIRKVLKGEFFFSVTFARNYKLFGGSKALKDDNFMPNLDPKSLRRSGMPSGILERGMLASYISIMLKTKGIFESEPNSAKAAIQVDKMMAALPQTVSNAYPIIAMPEWTRAGAAWLMPNIKRQMLIQAIEVLKKRQGSEFPGSIADIPDPISGGTVNYKRTAGGFMIYSSGPNGKDDGGPKNKTDRQKSDDFGFEYPFVQSQAKE